MSDSDSDCEYRSTEDDPRMDIAFLDHNFAIVNPQTSDDVFEYWGRISVEDKKKAGHLMKIWAFWLPILLQRDESNTLSCWAAQVGLVEPHKDLNLKHLHKIEILEAILRALEKGTLKKSQTKLIIWISNRFYLHSPEVLEDALHWLERTGEPNIRQRVLEFGHMDICFKALHLIFVEFCQYVKAMAISFDRTMNALTARPPEQDIKRSEEMKRKGNEQFQRKLYDDAVKFYSKAVKYYPDNHIIYGNRALCYIKSNNFMKAVGDGKRATLLKPLWAKGHYRYCEALFKLGEVQLALAANSSAQNLCKEDTDGIKDLEQQHQKFTSEVTQVHLQRNMSPRPTKTKEESTSVRQPSGVKPEKTSAPVRNTKGPETKVASHTQPGNKNSSTSSARSVSSDRKQSKSGQQAIHGKAENNVPVKKKSNENGAGEGKNQQIDVSKELSSAVGEAYTALDNHRSRNAEQAFSRALGLVSSSSGSSKVPGFSTIDLLLLHYGRVTALTEIGRSEELSEALRLLEKIQASEERTFQCLVCLAYGRVCVKENRYKAALKYFSDSLQMVKNQITPGKLTWPLTTHIVQETQPNYLKEILQDAMELCRFPPLPDAICRLQKCIGFNKTEIYFTDPDFKGFIQIHCCQSCSVEYHISCWKHLKTLSFHDKNEKDFLQDKCLTPDCTGQINGIKIFGPTGLMKCKFEVTIPKTKNPKKPKVNQKCTSMKKLKSKEDHRLRRKQYKHSSEDNPAISTEPGQQKEDTPPRTRFHFRDHVLLQISQHIELLRQERAVSVSALSCSLRPWLELDMSRGSALAGRMQKCLEESVDNLGAAVELLLERRNRVWGRVLVQVLSNSPDIQPKLSSWAHRLNSAGLSSAQYFMNCYSAELEQLDLSLLLKFNLLQELIIEKLDSKPEFFSSLGLTVTEYLQQSPPQDMRLFIWALEEHRDHYTSCHSILDRYFDMMDGLCSVIKKSEENHTVSSPIKSKHRGKKKNQRVFRVWSPGVSSREEWETDLLEDDSLSFLDEPFSVPSHLREQVATFEDQYNRSVMPSIKILETHREPEKESLYEYFAQILAEHGPLVADDPLLMGELKNFPVPAQQQIQAAGGLEAFLLESEGFIKIAGCVGLAQYSEGLQQASQDSLDQLDFIDTDSTSTTHPHQSSFFSYLRETYPTLPNPHVFDLYTDSGLLDSADSTPQDTVLTDCVSRLTIDEEADELPSVTDPPVQRENAPLKSGRASRHCIAINTDVNPAFESCHGELNKMIKSNQDMKKQIREVSMKCEKQQLQHKEKILVLEEELQNVTSNVQVTQKELTLFQHKLEEEVKKDQRDKKEHQEQLKALRQEVEGLQQEQERLKRSIKERKDAYESQLRDFLDLSNQSAAERMSLEDEIKRCKDLVAKANRRSLTAQLSVVESSRDQSLYNLHKELTDNKAVLRKLDEVAHRFSHQDLESTQNTLRAGVQEIEKKISSTETYYEELMEKVRNGSRLSELLPVSCAQSSEAASAQVLEADREQAAPPQLSEVVTAALMKKQRQHHTVRSQEASNPTVFERAVERLAAIFPNISRSELTRQIQKLRSSSGSLQSLGLQDVVSGVTQLILDQQEEQNLSGAKAKQGFSTCGTPPLGNSASAWQLLEPQKTIHSQALNTEDPCIICHEDMSAEDMCVLECRHSFHNECIRSWLKEQSTCPTCRDHALLPEDFPALSSRRHI